MIEFTPENAAHLLRRAGYGPRPEEAIKWSQKGLDATLKHLLKGCEPATTTTAGMNVHDLQAWWIRRLVASKRPLGDKMALFWHDHFATGATKVQSVKYMYRHLKKLRAKSLAPFRALLDSMVRDGALIIWLDSHKNKKEAPNENLARELMELFTTGVASKSGTPNYSQTDVQEAARALTGWSQERGKFLFVAEDHDFGVKKIKGVEGALDGAALLEILVADPATARHVAHKLFRFFAYDVALDDPLLAPLVKAWKDNDTSIRAMLEALFRSPAFYSEAAKRSRVKSPAEFLAGALRQLHAKVKPGPEWNNHLAHSLRAMGQDLLDPPSVFGWEQGLAWTSTNGMLQRARVAAGIAAARKELPTPIKWKATDLLGPEAEWPLLDATAVVERILAAFSIEHAGAATRSALLDYLETAPGGAHVPFALTEHTFDTKVRGVIALALSSPEYQLA